MKSWSIDGNETGMEGFISSQATVEDEDEGEGGNFMHGAVFQHYMHKMV